MAEMQKTLITKEGLEKMQKELEDLRTTKRAEVAQRLGIYEIGRASCRERV